MLVLLAAPAVLVAATLSPAQIKSCLGTETGYADWAAIVREKAAISPEAWKDACRQARDANERRLSATRVLRMTGVSPTGGYKSSAAFLARAKASEDGSVAKLFRLASEDQIARDGLRPNPINAGLTPLALKLYKAIVTVDAVNADTRSREWLRETVARRGWFKISRDGAEADRAAQLIVQHADEDTTFKGEMIALIEPLVAVGESDRGFFPYMYDRWAAQVGKPLRFGFQGACKANGVWESLPLEDAGHVDDRRKRYGVRTTFAEDIASNSKRCG